MKFKAVITLLILSSCSSGYLKYNGEKSITKNVDFEDKVKINSTESQTAEPQTAELAKAFPPAEVKSPVKVEKTGKSEANKAVGSKTKAIKNKAAVVASPATRQPELEDHVGFDGASRRPHVIPFKVGETVVHSVRYFKAEAGTMTFKVKPFVEVNNRKSYNFLIDIKTAGIFSSFYSVDDQVETYVDYEDLIPHVFKLHIKETGQLREAQQYFDHKTLKATYWEHKYTEKSGDEEKKQEWEILPFSQNAFSGIFYMRIFAWQIGKEYAFQVSDDQKNVIFKAVAVAKEKLSTDAGDFDAVKIQARVISRGALTTAEDINFWLSDDEQKYILRIEAKIKIGTVVSEAISIKPGTKE